MKTKKLLATLALISAVLITGCKKDDYKEQVGVCPVVVSVIPLDKAINVPLNQIIYATFNVEMNPATITQASFTLQQGATAITGAIGYSGKTATLTPSSPLIPFTVYTGRVKTLAKDLMGNSLQADYVWTFTTIPQVTLSSNPAAGGTTNGAGTFAQGSEVTVTATPNTGYVFTNWTENGTVVSTSASYKFTMPAGNRTLVANFTFQFGVVLSSNPIAGGTTTGAGSYNAGSSVTVTATTNTGYTFTNWTEGLTIVSTDANYIFTINGNRTLVANFTAIQYTVTLSSNPAAGGTTSGGGTFNSGSSVTVKAIPNAGYTFTNWKEGVTVVSTDANYTFTIIGNRTLEANFTAIPYSVTLSSNPPAGGNPTGGGQFNSGDQVNVKANPNAGYLFKNWTENGTIASTDPNYTFTITSNRILVANYTARYTVTLSSNPPAGGNPTGGGQFNSGDQVTVKPNPNSGYIFNNWTENGTIVSTDPNYSFTITSNRPLVANYTKSPAPTVVSTNPADGDKCVVPDKTVTAIFSLPMDPSNPATSFTLKQTLTSTPVAGIVTYSGTTASFNPSVNLLPNTLYTATITTGAKSLAGIPLEADYVWKFNTGCNPIVTLSSSPPLGGTTDGAGSYSSGTSVTVTASKNTGYNFVNWTENGTEVSSSPSYQFTMPGI